MALQLNDVAPARGWLWLREAFVAFWKRPLGFSSLFLSFMFAGLLAMALPGGALLLLFALPLLSLGYMIATRSALDGGPVHPGQLIEPLRAAQPEAKQRRRALLVLCAAYMAVSLAIIVISNWVDGGRFERLQELVARGGGSSATQTEIETLLGDPALAFGMMLRFGLASLLAIPFWHAPALVWWGGHGVGQALFSSSIAIWRTRGAFLGYVASWAALVGLFGLLVGFLLPLLGLQQLVGILTMPAALVFSIVFYVSLYFSYHDTFGMRRDAQG